MRTHCRLLVDAVTRPFGVASPKFTLVLALILSLAPLAPAYTQAIQKVGAAKAIENEVEGRLGRTVDKLAVGSEVFQNQLVRTGKASTANLQFLDNTNLSLSPSTEIKLDRFVYDPDRKTGAVVLQVPSGVVRFVTGSLEPRNYSIRTSLVTIGVRGTTFDVLVWPDRVTVMLVAGALDVTLRSRRAFALNEPGTAITVYRDGLVLGPRAWTGAIVDFASLAAPPRASIAKRLQERLVRATRGPERELTGSRGAASAMDRLGGNSAIDAVAGSRPTGNPSRDPRPVPCPACGPKLGTKVGGGGAGGGSSGISLSKPSAGGSSGISLSRSPSPPPQQKAPGSYPGAPK